MFLYFFKFIFDISTLKQSKKIYFEAKINKAFSKTRLDYKNKYIGKGCIQVNSQTSRMMMSLTSDQRK